MELILYTILIGAVVTDFHSWKIPNILILIGAAAGSVCQWKMGGMGALIAAYGRAGILIFVFFITFRMRAFGAGDIKLLATANLFLTTEDGLYALVWTFGIGVVFSIVKLIKEGNLRERFAYFFQYINRCRMTQQIERYREKQVDRSCMIHMSLPILLGHLVYLEVIR